MPLPILCKQQGYLASLDGIVKVGTIHFKIGGGFLVYWGLVRGDISG